METYNTLQQLILEEFEEIPCETFTILQFGKKYSKIKGFKQACQNFEQTLNQNLPIFRIKEDIDFFAKKIGVDALSKNILLQGEKQTEISNEKILGCYAVIQKRIHKQNNHKKKIVLHLQNQIDLIEVNPKTHTQENQQAREQIEEDLNPFGELYKQQYPDKKERSKIIRNKQFKFKEVNVIK